MNLARNVFHCFACGAGGTVLDFVAAMESCSLFLESGVKIAISDLNRLQSVNLAQDGIGQIL